MTAPRLTAAPLRPGRGGGGYSIPIPALDATAQISESLASLSSSLARMADVQARRRQDDAEREGAGEVSAETALGFRTVEDAEAAGAMSLSSDQARFAAHRTFGRAKAALYEADAQRALRDAYNGGRLSAATKREDIAKFLTDHLREWRAANVGDTADDVETERAFNEQTTETLARLLGRASETQDAQIRKRTESGLFALMHQTLVAGGTEDDLAARLSAAADRAIGDGNDEMMVQSAAARALRAYMVERGDGTLANVADKVKIGSTGLASVEEFASVRGEAVAQAENLRMAARQRKMNAREFDQADSWFALQRSIDADLAQGVSSAEVARRYKNQALAAGVLDNLNEYAAKANEWRNFSDTETHKALSSAYGRETLTWQMVASAQSRLSREDYGRFMQMAQTLTEMRRNRANALRENQWYLWQDGAAYGWQGYIASQLNTRLGRALDASGAIVTQAQREFMGLAGVIMPDERAFRSLTPQQQQELVNGMAELAIDRLRLADDQGFTMPLAGERLQRITTDPVVQGLLRRAPQQTNLMPRPTMDRQEVEALFPLIGDREAFEREARRMNKTGSYEVLSRGVRKNYETYQRLDAASGVIGRLGLTPAPNTNPNNR